MKALSGTLNPNAKAVAVIMAGGYGTRFWPESRRENPKQFLKLASDSESLLQQTAARVSQTQPGTDVMVVSGAEHLELVRAHLPEAVILSEPCGRNTAACLALAAQVVLDTVGDKVLLSLPADHLIKNVPAFGKALSQAASIVSANPVLLTFGISPTGPETGYGYIKRTDEQLSSSFRVQEFKEKPSKEVAEGFLQEGGYYWNSGMFAWRASVFLDAVKQNLPDLAKELPALSKLVTQDGADWTAYDRSYRALESVSVDVAILERAGNVVVSPQVELGWTDIGSWSAWSEVISESVTKDESGNVTTGESIFINSRDCAIRANSKLVAAVGIDNIVVVETEDALLVCRKDSDQDVKKIVAELDQRGLTKLL